MNTCMCGSVGLTVSRARIVRSAIAPAAHQAFFPDLLVNDALDELRQAVSRA